ncbi:hypothetical protein PF005_g13570 [Phytophthora fragariae]|uniref:Uncharacterized protein n=1 Tax=Phytophthora fragariae TaxID=53985 RepID=A0A6A3TSW9_9STRA|nr:hypothetical protein PF003_g2544 [Phytophthora fragariae]KAE8937217.1 hypothetical protein PF009_g12882 [Phytophthora fragariae]KAE9000216.1 hypothetical protein PF011_g14282 [Phytophthora fragariae]KAE9104857.1 hypothetical protein PF010_g13230 [Phytophthora fragariae]KAE9105076.1 hypothetical protein PF007_g13826 [Phytophthora fragariae]
MPSEVSCMCITLSVYACILTDTTTTTCSLSWNTSCLSYRSPLMSPLTTRR